MEQAQSVAERNIGEMKKRRVLMADGKRYLIYYTFENATVADAETLNQPQPTQAGENV